MSKKHGSCYMVPYLCDPFPHVITLCSTIVFFLKFSSKYVLCLLGNDSGERLLRAEVYAFHAEPGERSHAVGSL